MNKAFSIYLDLVRFIAACLVYLYHSNMRLLVKEPLPASQYGHASVIVFFVLSGFVIAHVAHTKEDNWIDFSASRLSRIYSVVVPALVLTLLLDGIGRHLYPALYDYPYDQIVVRLLASLLMLNEVWFVSITSLSNVPFWSITYEAWYYVLFALVFFLPPRCGLMLAAALLLVLGPKVLLLLPVWGAGVLLYRWKALERMSLAMGAALALSSFVAIPVLYLLGVFAAITDWTAASLGSDWFRELTFSRFAIGDYLLCALVFMNFAGMRRVAPHLAPLLLAVERPVRLLAGYTFTLYLLHQPLFLFWGAVIRGDPTGPGYWALMTLATAGSVALVGHFTENKRHLLKAWIQRQLRRGANAFDARRASTARTLP
jgi:peptidoglycan/LPS O-acetylase OafA/YrhL